MMLSSWIVLAVAVAGVGGKDTEDKVTTQPPTLAVDARLTLTVADSQKAAGALVDKAEQLGGYFADRGDQHVSLKVPTAKVDELLSFATTLGDVLQRSQQAHDLRMTLYEQQTRVSSKEKMLEQYLTVLRSARPQAVVIVERQITQLIQEIESLKGAIRVLEHRLQMASVYVSFRIEKPKTPVADGSSPFPWLNTVNLVDLYRDFASAPQ